MQDHDVAYDSRKEALCMREPTVSPGIPARRERAGHACAQERGLRAADPTAAAMKEALSFSLQGNLLRILTITSALYHLGGWHHAEGLQASRTVPAEPGPADASCSQAGYPLLWAW